MNKKNLFLICFSLFLSSKAYSQDTNDAVGDKNQSWYASASFATAIWSSDYWNERYSSDADAVVSHDNAKFEEWMLNLFSNAVTTLDQSPTGAL